MSDLPAIPDQMFAALERAETIAEVKDVLDFAETARAFARRAKLGIEQENRAAELSLRAQRKAGRLAAVTDDDRRPHWRVRHRLAGTSPADGPLVRQLAGYARRFADVAGHDLTATDVLAALNDTGLCFIQDSEGFAADAHRWAVFVIAADPLDLDTAQDGIDSHWDREQEGRDEADQRPTRRRFDQEEDG